MVIKAVLFFSGLFQYPFVICGPAIQSSPFCPSGSGCPFSSIIVARTLARGLPMDRSPLAV